MATRKSLPDFDYRDRVGDGRKAELDEFCATIGVKKIKDYNLYNRALSHKSFTNEQGWSHNEQYEKLEFFGDSVLGLVVNEYLFKSFPDYEEGDLSKIKSAAVSEPTLAEAAKRLGLGALILIGRGETRGGGTERPSLLADVFEAVIGAVYLDQGLPTARKFVLQYLKDSVHTLSDEDSTGDYKSYFQEVVQKERGLRPQYSVMKSSGPDHSRKFKISVSIGGKRWGIGEGKSKKEAEQDAAENAFKAWDEAKKNPPKGRAPRKGRGPDRGARDESSEPGLATERSSERAGGGSPFDGDRNGFDRGPRRRGRGARARQMARSISMEEVVAQGLDPVAAAAGALDYPFRRRDAEPRPAARPEHVSGSSGNPEFDENEDRSSSTAPRTDHISTDLGDDRPGDGEAAGEKRGRRGRRGGRGRRGAKSETRGGERNTSSRDDADGNRAPAASAPGNADVLEENFNRDHDRELPSTVSGNTEDGSTSTVPGADDRGEHRRRGRRRGGRGRKRSTPASENGGASESDAKREERPRSEHGEGRAPAHPKPAQAPSRTGDGRFGGGRPERGGEAERAGSGDRNARSGRGRRGGRGRSGEPPAQDTKPTSGRGTRGSSKQAPRPSREDVFQADLRPDKPIDDPISWAAGETFVRRPRRR